MFAGARGMHGGGVGWWAHQKEYDSVNYPLHVCPMLYQAICHGMGPLYPRVNEMCFQLVTLLEISWFGDQDWEN